MKTPKYTSANWNEIPDDKINEGVRIMVEFIDMNGGSNGDLDLYVLIRNYIKRRDARTAINDVMNNKGCI